MGQRPNEWTGLFHLARWARVHWPILGQPEAWEWYDAVARWWAVRRPVGQRAPAWQRYSHLQDRKLRVWNLGIWPLHRLVKTCQNVKMPKDKARDVHRLLRVLRPLASQYPHCANTMPLPDGWSGSWRKSHLTHDTAWCKSHPRRNSCPGIPDISGSFHAILGNSPLVFLISRIVDTNCSTVA